MLAQPADRVNGGWPEIKNGGLRQTCTFSEEIFMVKGALLGERLEVVVAPGRKSSVVCFVEVTSFSTFCAEPGRSGVERTVLGAGRGWRRKLARVNRRERNSVTAVEFSGGTVLGIRNRVTTVEFSGGTVLGIW